MILRPRHNFRRMGTGMRMRIQRRVVSVALLLNIVPVVNIIININIMITIIVTAVGTFARIRMVFVILLDVNIENTGMIAGGRVVGEARSLMIESENVMVMTILVIIIFVLLLLLMASHRRRQCRR